MYYLYVYIYYLYIYIYVLFICMYICIIYIYILFIYIYCLYIYILFIYIYMSYICMSSYSVSRPSCLSRVSTWQNPAEWFDACLDKHQDILGISLKVRSTTKNTHGERLKKKYLKLGECLPRTLSGKHKTFWDLDFAHLPPSSTTLTKTQMFQADFLSLADHLLREHYKKYQLYPTLASMPYK